VDFWWILRFYTYTDTNADSDSYTNADPDSDTNTYANSHPNADSNSRMRDLGGRRNLHCRTGCSVQRHDLHGFGQPNGHCRYRLESYRRQFVQGGRHMRHADAYSNAYSNADTDTDTDTDANTHTYSDTYPDSGQRFADSRAGRLSPFQFRQWFRLHSDG
jgi:hypothetical protein